MFCKLLLPLRRFNINFSNMFALSEKYRYILLTVCVVCNALGIAQDKDKVVEHCFADTVLAIQTHPLGERENGTQCLWDFSSIKDSCVQKIEVFTQDSIYWNVHTRNINKQYRLEGDTLCLEEIQTSQVYLRFNTPIRLFATSMNYQDSIAGSFSALGEYEHTLPVTVKGYCCTSIDGIGTLVLPQLQVDSVLRVHTHFAFNKADVGASQAVIDEYCWINKQALYPLCQTEHIRYIVDKDTTTNTLSYYLPIDTTELRLHNKHIVAETVSAATTTNSIDNLFTNATFLPNPVSTRLSISYDLSRSATVRFSLHSNVGICHIQTPSSLEESGHHQLYINMASLPTDTYVLYIFVDDYVVAETIIKI